MSVLDGVVPYAIAPGNHDGLFFDRETVEFNTFFPVREYEDLPSFGGVFEEDKLDNTYHYFSSGGVDWLVLALEFGPRDQVLDWANQVVSDHRDRKVMIVTHTYLYADDTLHGSKPTHKWSPHDHPIADEEGGANDGVEIWEKLVRKHDNIVFIFNGHVLDDGVGRLVSTGDHGNQVYQMLANYQKTGGGFLRLLELVPEENRASIRTYSPVSDEYKNDNQNKFEFELSIFDTIPPEALVRFDRQIEDIVVEGLDNKDEFVEVDNYEECIKRKRGKCILGIRKYLLTDDHGSTLTLGMTHQKKRRSVKIEISDLRYNDRNLIDIGRNSFKTIFNSIFFHQQLRLDSVSAATFYTKGKDGTVVSMNGSGSRETTLEEGLIEFNLRTYELERMMMDLEGLLDVIDEKSAIWAEREEAYRQVRESIRQALEDGTIGEEGHETMMALLDASYLGPAAQEEMRQEIDALIEEHAVLEEEISGGLRLDGENGVIIAPITDGSLSADPIR
jgi:hypothetical protein